MTQIVVPPEAESSDDDGIPNQLPLLVLQNQVVFPMSVTPLRITSEGEAKLIDDAAIRHRMVALLAQSPPPEKKRRAEDQEKRKGLDRTYKIGVVGRILQLQHAPDGSVNVMVQAMRRFRATGLVQSEPYPVVSVEVLEEPEPDMEEVAPLAQAIKSQMSSMIELSPNIPDNANAVLAGIEEPGFLADLVTANLPIKIEEKQDLLETLDVAKRLKKLTRILARELELMKLSDKIQTEVKGSIDKGQREFYLRQQLKAIQEELGEGAGARPEIAEYEEKLKALALPDDARKEAERELNRLKQMNEASAEYHVILTYLDWICDLPWNQSTEDKLDVDRAERILNEDHYGLEKVKKRILEYLAVRKLKPDAPGPILCFVGPPGVGKTSLGQSIARALDRKFVRMSLGGVRDEAEIRGHRKTYVGALPGRIIQSIRKAGSDNPVFMLDEIDKVGSDFRGDPSSALLEVLDPAQNDTFSDHYLNVTWDLSKVMFIATANVLDTIPWALRDRMEIIQIPGYNQKEKVNIARKYLVPRQLEAHGLTRKGMTLQVSALRKIIESYTREAGVRNLEREIANVCRGVARKFAEGRKAKVKVGPDDLKEYLGSEKVFREVAERTSIPGVATGLAWTATGGDILFVEATRMPGKGNLILTGQLGDVMKESAQAVLSYVRTNAGQLGLENEDFSSFDMHIHVPAGAVPKDGPSAGVAILTAVVSLLKGQRVSSQLGMTGEITLRGMVLPVGGIKEKVLAASRAGLKQVILPERNQNDLEDVPEETRKKMTFHAAQRMEDVLAVALGTPKKWSAGKKTAKKAPRKRKKS